MITTIYIERDLVDHFRVKEIVSRFNGVEIIYCEHYREVFNVGAQNFRLQKQHPSLILAQKPSNLIQSCPEGYGVGGQKNYYFSYMLNCR